MEATLPCSRGRDERTCEGRGHLQCACIIGTADRDAAGHRATVASGSGEEHDMKRMLALGMAGLVAVPLQAFAHGGGLDAQGCHHNRKTGDYHCHRAQAIPVQAPASQAGTGLSGAHRTATVPGSPTCHVGPRGGTYTITANGRKNYADC